MKTKKLAPRNVAPVKRENAATSNNNTASADVSPSFPFIPFPFAGDDAE